MNQINKTTQGEHLTDSREFVYSWEPMFPVSRVVNGPRLWFRATEPENVNAVYESKVNLWGKTQNGKWHLICLQAEPADAEKVEGQMEGFGFVETHIQKPYTRPPYVSAE